MATPHRELPGELIYHVLNRAVGKMKLFSRPKDFLAFEQTLVDCQRIHPMRILSYCIMPNHWHLVLWPERDGDLSRFMHWLTCTHAKRWRVARQLLGLGPLYQGRFKAFPVECDSHFLTVCRYVERNALRANLVQRAEAWEWSSLHAREDATRPSRAQLLTEWLVDRPPEWTNIVNRAESAAEHEALTRAIRTGRPFGNPAWSKKVSAQLGIPESHKPGRPARAENTI